VTLANFHSDGKEDNDSDMLNNLHSGYFNIGAASRKSRGLIQSGPVALLVSKMEVRVVFCDVSKAFDRVWHKGLLTKLKSIGIHGPLLSWIENYLLDRKQRVVING
jgi:hypothetical protein